jgi:hypothetical protein
MANRPDLTKFAALAAVGLAELQDRDLRGEQLPLVLQVSVWLRRSGVELAAAPRALLILRRSLLQIARIDPSTEPVPIVVSDGQRAVLSLCVYLYGLIKRAAHGLSCQPNELVQSVLEQLGAKTAQRSS